MQNEIRSFIAIEIDENLKDKFLEIQQELLKIDFGFKLVAKENLHLTLKFLGNVKHEKLEKVKENLKEIFSDEKSFDISFSGIGCFPNLNNPKVIWIGVADGKENLVKCANKIEDKMARIGFKKEHEFSPHLTISRVRAAKDKHKFQDLVKKYSNINFGKSRTNKINLMKSTLTPKAPIYEVLEEFLLS